MGVKKYDVKKPITPKPLHIIKSGILIKLDSKLCLQFVLIMLEWRFVRLSLWKLDKYFKSLAIQ